MKKQKRITITDIAKLAGVSKTTASLVLNGRGKEMRVADETIQRITSIARQYQYQPNIHARSLRDNRSYALGLVIPDITNYGFASVAYELEVLCREAGIQLLISCTDENAAQETLAIEHLLSRQIDGLIVASCLQSDFEYQRLSQQIPVVLFDRYFEGTTLPFVATDATTATQQLIADITSIEQPNSLNEFYFLGGQSTLSPTKDRLLGFTQGLTQAGITPKAEWIIHGHYHPSSGYEMFGSLCATLGRPPKFVFTSACGLLDGVLRYLSQNKILQSSVYLAGFDDHYLYDSLSVPIDTIAQNNPLLASHCFRLIMALINHNDLETHQIFIPAEIRKRH
ncbi:LacI family DNA-binding transcriptional regulator [Proteus hauseri]|uniref:LacI family DNA-binding transcriptional regulator n=1 Tax=Proteus hauseri TaxID=183417 RepID=UPI0032D9E48B